MGVEEMGVEEMGVEEMRCWVFGLGGRVGGWRSVLVGRRGCRR